MAVTQIVGPRIAPYWADPVEWTSTRAYEPFTFVTYQGDSYCSRQDTPIGIDITNDDYWVKVSDYNAQAVALQREMTNTIEAAESSMTNTIQAAENTMTSTINEAKEDFNESINVFNQYLPFDIEPKDGSSKGVTSNGVFSAISELSNTVNQYLPFDIEPKDGSSKGVTSNGVFSAISALSNTVTNIQGIRIYDNVAAMQADTTIIDYANYNLAITKGFYSANDGGGCFYYITDKEITPNDMDSFALQNGYYAVFAGAVNEPIVDCFGAKSDDDTIDNAPIINYVLSTYKIAYLMGHYHVLTGVTVNNGQNLTTLGCYQDSYGYVHKNGTGANQIFSFQKLMGVLYTDDNFTDTAIVTVNNGEVSKILVTNLSASPTNIYVPSFNGFNIHQSSGTAYGYCHHIAASGCKVGINYQAASGSMAYNLIGSACICGIKIIASDNRFINLEANTNIHMAPTITPQASTGGFNSTLTGIMIFGGDNQFTNIRAEWCYYGINITPLGNHITNTLIDWCDIGIKYIPNSQKPSEDLWDCVAAFCRTYYVEMTENYPATTKVFMTGCSFQTSDGSARFVESGDNVMPTGTPLNIYPSADTGVEFTISNSDLSYMTTQNNGTYSDVLTYNPYCYTTITNCKLRNEIAKNPTAHYLFVNNYTNSARK